jgi:hypothetical protein
MADEERLRGLEATMAEQKKTSVRLEALMIEMCNQMTQPPLPPLKAEPNLPAHVLSLLTTGKGLKLKPTPLSDFDGNRKKGRKFLNQCKLYIKLCETDFTDETTMIHWALSYMKSGCVATVTFTEEIISHETTKGLLRFDTWLDFCKEFEERFCLLDEATMAVNRLE